jgi:O-antigen ligase
MAQFAQSDSKAQRRLERMIFIFVLLVQQNAFVSIPLIVNGESLGDVRGVENIFNTIGVALSLVLIGWISLRRLRSLTYLGRANVWSVLYTCLVLLSAFWSIHPNITIRRGVGYVLTIIVAALLPLRFGVTGSMKVLSNSFAISALGSFLFVAMFPQYGIMQLQGLEGCWQGVFDTKQLLGAVMTVAIFVELYILVSSARKEWWRYCLLIAYGALLLLSRSMTQFLIALAYTAGTGAYLLWKQSGWRGVSAGITLACALLVGSLIVFPDSRSVLAVIGKDPTLTGRANFWPSILGLVKERPVLGWGYRAMFQPDDAATASVDAVAGIEVPGAHNAFLEVALDLGCAGLLVMAVMILLAIYRGARCCSNGFGLLGWFSTMFIVGTVTAGLTTETLGQNQIIEWLVFNVLLFGCGLCSQSVKVETAPQSRHNEVAYRGVSTLCAH